MSRNVAATCAAALLVIVTAGVYTAQLGVSPPFLMHDELQFSLQARSIATTGHDLAGRAWPVFFTEPEFPPGRDPLLIYFTAAVLQFVSFSQENVKLAVALLGILNVVLIFFAGRRLFENPWLGVLAAVLLALTPIHFIRARLVLSPFASLPCIIAWVWALAAYLRSGSRAALLTGVAALALSTYAYLACLVMAPIYLACTGWLAVRRDGGKILMPIIATFAVLLLPMAVWYLTHPERSAQLIEAYRLYGSGTDAVAAPMLAPGTPTSPQRWVGLVWQFMSPDFLFVSGDSSLINSTRTAGLFPMAFAVLIVAGLWHIARSADPGLRVVLIGLMTAPAASVLSGAVEMNRAMAVIPFGVLCATIGASSLLSAGGARRALAVGLLVWVPLQFVEFHRHYIEQYPRQAGAWFGGNVRDAVIETGGGTGPVYLSTRIPFVHRYWAFYTSDNAREVRYFTDPPAAAPSGARAACAESDGACQQMKRSGEWRELSTATDASGSPRFLVLSRQ